MTLDDIARIPKEYLTAAQVAGSRVKIPKEAFLRVMRGL